LISIVKNIFFSTIEPDILYANDVVEKERHVLRFNNKIEEAKISSLVTLFFDALSITAAQK